MDFSKAFLFGFPIYLLKTVGVGLMITPLV